MREKIEGKSKKNANVEEVFIGGKNQGGKRTVTNMAPQDKSKDRTRANHVTPKNMHMTNTEKHINPPYRIIEYTSFLCITRHKSGIKVSKFPKKHQDLGDLTMNIAQNHLRYAKRVSDEDGLFVF